MKFFVCETCKNMVEVLKDSGMPIVCCGKNMKELIPGTTDGTAEKHVPVVTIKGDKVKVKIGSEPHPMIDTHYIEWIAIETKKGTQRKKLKPGDEPCAEFLLTDKDEFIAAYEYCNVHSLWKSK